MQQSVLSAPLLAVGCRKVSTDSEAPVRTVGAAPRVTVRLGKPH